MLLRQDPASWRSSTLALHGGDEHDGVALVQQRECAAWATVCEHIKLHLATGVGPMFIYFKCGLDVRHTFHPVPPPACYDTVMLSLVEYFNIQILVDRMV